MYLHQGTTRPAHATYRRPKQRLRGEVYMQPINREKLKERRIREGFNQRQLAILCNCSQAAISALETGTMKQCSEDLAIQISKWLKRDLDELFIRKEDSRAHRVTNAAGSTRHKTLIQI